MPSSSFASTFSGFLPPLALALLRLLSLSPFSQNCQLLLPPPLSLPGKTSLDGAFPSFLLRISGSHNGPWWSLWSMMRTVSVGNYLRPIVVSCSLVSCSAVSVGTPKSFGSMTPSSHFLGVVFSSGYMAAGFGLLCSFGVCSWVASFTYVSAMYYGFLSCIFSLFISFLD
uniref:Uncharacterized protein n=1 Tax=Opuntia streptacantha TaxID=393608 RepID=A0A7C9CZR3_OPUST